MILLIDNYDSFTYNLAQALRGLGAELDVRRNDALTVGEVEAMAPAAIVLSPGPGRPEDAGITLGVARHFLGRTPLLGVCLGHQALGMVLGARVVHAPAPVHGKATSIRHDESLLFRGLSSPLPVGRYHSLVLERASLPAEARVTAETADGVVMAIDLGERRAWGVQFHPESILTPDGPAMLARFLACSASAAPAQGASSGGQSPPNTW